jgi:hypothetical protein
MGEHGKRRRRRQPARRVVSRCAFPVDPCPIECGRSAAVGDRRRNRNRERRGEFFGTERLEACGCEGFAAIERAVTEFRGSMPLNDDCTITEVVYCD